VGWKDAFGDAMKELEAIRQQLARLDDPNVGLTALHGDLTQSRLKILEQLQAGVTGLREENREVRRRQDRMISDLNETRGELRQLLDLVDVLRPFAPPPEGTGDKDGEGAHTYPEETVQPPKLEAEAGYGSTAPAEGHPPASSGTDSQGGTMENTEHRPQSEVRSEDPDLGLKKRHRGRPTRAPASPSASPLLRPWRPPPARMIHASPTASYC
jgi:hypothetical protein